MRNEKKTKNQSKNARWNSRPNVLRFGLKKTLCQTQTTVEATVADCSTRPVQRTRN